MLCYTSRLPLSRERQKRVCLFCRLVSSLALLFRLFIVKIRLRILHPGAPLIGVALLEHLGDIVASEPLVRELRAMHPRAFIVYCLGSAYRELADSNPNCNMTVPLHDLSHWMVIANSGLLDRVVDLHLPGRTCKSCDVTLYKTASNPDINSRNYYQFGNLLAVMAQSSGLRIVDDGPLLYIPTPVFRKIDAMELPSLFVCIHCMSNEADRNWDTGKWRALIGILANSHHIPVIQIGHESATLHVEARLFSSLCGQLTILETAEVIRRASIFIGVDSGPAHLANAVGTFGIILLGKYREFINHMPYSGHYQDGSNSLIIRSSCPTRDIAVTAVTDAVLGALETRWQRGKIET